MKTTLFIFVMLIGLSSYSHQSLHISLQTAPVESLKEKVLRQLGINETEVRDELFEEKVLPYAPTQTVMAIPKLVSEDDHLFTVDLILVVVNNQSGKIIQKFTEENYLHSDAIYVSGITIDTAPYLLSKTIRAFGIRVHYSGSSRPNPYGEDFLSLYVQEGSILRRVLKDEVVGIYHGEWDTNCSGEFHDTKCIVSFETEMSNGYFNLVLKYKTSSTVNEPVNGDCKEKLIGKLEKKSVFYYNGKSYN